MARGRRQTQPRLTWIGKDQRQTPGPRTLREDPAKSHRSRNRAPDEIVENILILGDNLPALHALAANFAGRVKCAYLDPPYNTGTAFEHYDDGIEHAHWLSLMRDRVERVRELLADDGVLVAQIGFDEMAYLKVQLDEVFGRDHCIGQVAVRMSHSAGMKRQAKDRRLIKNTEYLLFYFNTDQPSLSALYEPCTEYPVNYYQYVAELPSDDGPGVYVPLAQTLEDRIPGIFDAHGLRPTNASIRRLFLVDARVGEFAIAERDRIVRKHAEVPRCDLDLSALRDDQFVEYRTNRRSYWMGSTDRGSLYQLIPLTDKVRTVDTLDEDGRLERTEVIANLLGDWWDGYWRDMSRVDHEGGVLMKESKKPERLIASVLALLTGPGDLVLDPFLGSGTTAAVAHKMGRRWIGIELGEHCESLALERLRRVVDGTDPTGITRSSGWRGGGGFRFFRLISQATEAGDDERRGRASIPTRPASR